MQQLDVHADEETLELEVEVERLLCEQEAEARKQVVHLERSFQPSGESVTLELAKENKKPQDRAASPKVDEQGTFAPCWAGLIACTPREVARVSQAMLKARSLYQFLIRGLCLGGHDITLQKVLLAVKRTCQPVCRAAGAAGLQVQLDPEHGDVIMIPLSARLAVRVGFTCCYLTWLESDSYSIATPGHQGFT